MGIRSRSCISSQPRGPPLSGKATIAADMPRCFSLTLAERLSKKYGLRLNGLRLNGLRLICILIARLPDWI
jgi:hypothetical protein